MSFDITVVISISFSLYKCVRPRNYKDRILPCIRCIKFVMYYFLAATDAEHTYLRIAFLIITHTRNKLQQKLPFLSVLPRVM